MKRNTRRLFATDCIVFCLGMLLGNCAPAATLYWDGTGTYWDTASSWSTAENAATPNPSSRPGASDIATFNITPLADATVNVRIDHSALGLVFNSAGNVTLQSPSVYNNVVIGASGIAINPAAGKVTSNVGGLGLFTDQTWKNDSANAFEVYSYIFGNANIRGPLSTLTIAGSGNTTLIGELDSVNKLVKNGTGTLTIGGIYDNIALTVVANSGTVILDKASVATPGLGIEVHAIGTGLTVAGALVQLAGTGGDQIYQSDTVDIQSGTFDMNGRNEGFRHLKLNGGGVGDMGALVNNVPGTMTTLEIPMTGSMTLTGDTTVGGAGDLAVTGFSLTSTGHYSVTKVGIGTIYLPNGNYKDISVAAGKLYISGTAFAAASGTVTVDPHARFGTAGITTARTFNVHGALEVYPTTTLQLTGGQLINNGSVSGMLGINNGSLAKGSGAYDIVTVSDGGTFAPGNSPGVTTANSLTFTDAVAAGTPILSIEIGGTIPGIEHDQLHVTGALTLAGRLDVSLLNGYVPAAADSFDILDFGSLAGTFSMLNLPTLPPALAWDTSQLYTTGTLAVVAVPEPLAPLLLASLGFFLARTRSVARSH